MLTMAVTWILLMVLLVSFFSGMMLLYMYTKTKDPKHLLIGFLLGIIVPGIIGFYFLHQIFTPINPAEVFK